MTLKKKKKTPITNTELSFTHQSETIQQIPEQLPLNPLDYRTSRHLSIFERSGH